MGCLAAFFKRSAGGVVLCVVVSSWVATTEVAQLLVVEKNQYSDTLAIIWFNHTWLLLSIFPYFLVQLVRYSRRDQSYEFKELTFMRFVSQDVRDAFCSFLKLSTHSTVLGLGYFLINAVWYMGIPLTTAADSNVIFQSECAFIVILSAILLKESIRPLKLIAVLVCLGGVVVTTYSGKNESSTTGTTNHNEFFGCGTLARCRFVGDIIIAITAFLWAVYEVPHLSTM